MPAMRERSKRKARRLDPASLGNCCHPNTTMRAPEAENNKQPLKTVEKAEFGREAARARRGSWQTKKVGEMDAVTLEHLHVGL